MTTSHHILFIGHHPALFSPWQAACKANGHTVRVIDAKLNEPLTEEQLQDVTLVIEWLPLKNGVKEQTLKLLDSALPDSTLILSSADEVLSTTIAAWLRSPQRLTGFSAIGLHREGNTVTLTTPFGHHASNAVENFFKSIDILPHWIQDTPGMVLPRIYSMIVNEAAFALQEEVASVEDIDTAMKLGTNYPYGPFTWADIVGVDTVLNILTHLYATYREERYRPCLLLQKMVSAKRLGKACGWGFYDYRTPGQTTQEEAPVNCMV